MAATSSPTAPSEEGARPDALLTYVYAILPSGAGGVAAVSALTTGRITGIAGTALRPVESAGLVAVVGDVPAEQFDEAPLNDLLRNLDWLGPRAEAHQQVNAQVAALSDASLPLAFGTIYRADESLRHYLESERTDLLARLDAVRGQFEWVLALRRDQPAATQAVERDSDAFRALNDEIASSPPGRAYLLRRRLGVLAKEEVERLDRAAAGEVVALVERLGGRTYPERIAAENETAAGATVRVILRLSALVRRDAAGALLDDVGDFDRTWRGRGYTLDATGPWPTYRFGALGAAPGDGELTETSGGRA